MNDELEVDELIDQNADGVIEEEQGELGLHERSDDVELEAEEDEIEVKENDKASKLQKALNEERAARKRLERENKKLKNSSNSTYSELVEKGVDPELAKTLTNVINKPNKDIANLQFSAELLRASKKPEFADIEDYEEEVRTFVDKGLTVEQAYYAVTGGRKKSNNTQSDIARKLEAKMKNQQEKAKILDIDTSNTAGNVAEKKIKYTAAELEAASEAEMSIEEYKAFQRINSISDYEKYMGNKAKK